MEDRGEEIAKGPWTIFEFMVFKGTIQYHLEEGLPLTSQSLYTSYSQIVDVVDACDDLQVPLSRKTVQQVAGKLERHFEVLSVFQTLFCQQISFNVT